MRFCAIVQHPVPLLSSCEGTYMLCPTQLSLLCCANWGAWALKLPPARHLHPAQNSSVALLHILLIFSPTASPRTRCSIPEMLQGLNFPSHLAFSDSGLLSQLVPPSPQPRSSQKAEQFSNFWRSPNGAFLGLIPSLHKIQPQLDVSCSVV